jgi:hypothetical protein
VFWYTRRVPWGLACERRDELMSDLWEHADLAARSGQSRVAHQLAVIRRMLAGMRADLSWRRTTRRHSSAVVLAATSTVGPREASASKRWICRVITHRERRFPYPGNDDAGGHYFLCTRCGRVRDDAYLAHGHGLLRFEDRERERQRAATRWPL